MRPEEEGVITINVNVKRPLCEEIQHVIKNGLKLTNNGNIQPQVRNGKIVLKLLDPYKRIKREVMGVNAKQLIDLAKKNNSCLNIHHLGAILDNQEKIPTGWRDFDVIFPTIVFMNDKGCKHAPLIRFGKGLGKWFLLFTYCCDIRISNHWRLLVANKQ